MLHIVDHFRNLRFLELMVVYEASNRIRGAQDHPFASRIEQLLLAEQDHCRFLRDCFFATPGALLCIWEQGGQYVSALRLEPYRDGFLVTGLETAPEQHGRGYASSLLMTVSRQMDGKTLYSHVDRSNGASLRVHEKCGFCKILDHAVYLDGSASRSACTLRRECADFSGNTCMNGRLVI